VAHVSGPAGSVAHPQLHLEAVLEQSDEIKKGMSAALPHVECFSDALPTTGCQQVSANHVIYIGKVPRLKAVPMNLERFPQKGRAYETGYNCGILGVGILSGSINIKIAKTYRFDPVKFSEHPAIVV